MDAIGYEFWNEEYAYFSQKEYTGPRRQGADDPTVFHLSTAEELLAVHHARERGMTLPLSLEAWVEEVGVVDLCGSHSTLCFFLGQSNWPNIFANPMMVKPQFEQQDGPVLSLNANGANIMPRNGQSLASCRRESGAKRKLPYP